MTVTVHHGDSREVLRAIPDDSMDSCATDPPYALSSIVKRFGDKGAAPAREGKTGAYARASAGFMGQKWDTGDTAFDPNFWREVYRVLKPGAHLIAFGGTRTYHRLACAIEDAGFEIRDMTAWLYGSGFPKSHDVAKGIDKSLGAVREVVGTREAPGFARANVEHGAQTRTTTTFDRTSAEAITDEARAWDGWGTALKPAFEPCVLARKPTVGTVAANVLAHGTGALNIDACRIDIVEGEREVIDARSGAGFGTGNTVGGHQGRDAGTFKSHAKGRWPANVLHDGSEEVEAAFPASDSTPFRANDPDAALHGGGIVARSAGGFSDAGSAARFFYSAKADAEDRLGSAHPTVKPVDLMRWMITLITPPGGHVLDPFAGTGTTALAALGSGFDCTLIEREAAYVEDINRRLAWARGEGGLTAQEKRKGKPPAPKGHGPLFDDG